MAERRQTPKAANRAAKSALRVWQQRVAANARLFRESRAWTQESAAERCQIEPRHLQTIEAGSANLTLETLARLCAGYGLDPLELVADVPAPKKRPPGRPKATTPPKGR